MFDFIKFKCIGCLQIKMKLIAKQKTLIVNQPFFIKTNKCYLRGFKINYG